MICLFSGCKITFRDEIIWFRKWDSSVPENDFRSGEEGSPFTPAPTVLKSKKKKKITLRFYDHFHFIEICTILYI